MNIARLRRLAVSCTVLIATASAACQRVPLLAPTGSTITLTSATGSLPINGTTQLIAQIVEASGTPPHSGTHIIFTTTLGTIEPSETQTDINGRAVVTFRAGTASGTASITASSGAATVSSANALKIAIGSAAATQLVVAASPTTLPANGGTATIFATVRDASSNTLAGVPVTFSTNAGTLGSTTAMSDANGIAQTTLTTNRTATVTATAGSVTAPPPSGGTGTGTTTNVSNQVTVNVNSGPSISFGTVSPAAPVAGQLVSFPITIAAPGTTGSPLRSLVVDFGDGRQQQMSPGSATAVTASHVYSAPGIYTVTAVGTDTNGDTSSAQIQVAIGRAPAPTVGLTVDTPPPLHKSTPIQFTITAALGANAPPNSSIENVTIDFGDGTSASLGNAATTRVQHVYSVENQYVVTATVTDTNGGVGRTSTIIIIGP